MNPAHVIGIDGGGTSTHAMLADANGQILGEGVAGPSNAKAVGPEAARQALDQAIAAAFADARLDRRAVAIVCFGLAGFDRPEDHALLRDWASAGLWADRLTFVNDGELVLAAGTPDGFGVGVIAGTGSIAVGKGKSGRTTRAGGWGHLFGDEGSAYLVALAGLRMVAQRDDGRLPPAPNAALADGLCRAVGVSEPRQLITAIYSGEFDRTRLASLAPAVVVCAAEDPDVLETILKPAGRDLARSILAVVRAIDWSPSDTLPLAMAGGFLLQAEPVAQAMLDDLNSTQGEFHGVQPFPVPEPALGAVILACRALEYGS